METTKICNKRPGVQLPSLNDVQACGRRIAGVVKRTPVVRLGTHLVKLNHQSVRVSRQKGSECSSDSASVSDSIRDVSGEIEVFLKLENEQHCGSVKSRSAASYLSALEQRADGDDALRRGVVTASTGNFGQSLAWLTKKKNIRCAVVVPDFTDAYRRALIKSAGADLVIDVPFHEWWQCVELATLCPSVAARHPEIADMHFVSQVSPECIAGDATVADEIFADVNNIDAVVVPYGFGSFSCGTGVVAKQRSRGTRVVAVEIETSSPFRNALVAGKPYRCTHTPSFVSQLGGQMALPTIWDQINSENGLITDSAVVQLEQVAEAMRVLKRNHDIVAEGSGAASLAAVLSGQAGRGRVVCVITGGNVERDMMADIMTGGLPPAGLPIPPAIGGLPPAGMPIPHVMSSSALIWEPSEDTDDRNKAMTSATSQTAASISSNNAQPVPEVAS
ncbi:probable serine racemase [Sycon ciliatum]|uniref:probable serine racemase n=1 Tax=Sycon ciliatum TaxID=27933 RepID=UPI0031F70461